VITRPLSAGEQGTPYYTQDFGSFDDTLIPVANPDYRAVPVRFSDYGANGDFEVIEYNLESSIDFVKGFEVSQHIGVITELWPGNVTPLRDAAKIDVAGLGAGSFDWVDIFYHCDGANSAEGGMTAFEVGDEVVVLNEGGNPNPAPDDLVIVGFKDELRTCVPTVLLIQLHTEYIFWDLEKNTPYSKIENQPLSWSEMTAKINELHLTMVAGLTSVSCGYSGFVECPVPEIIGCVLQPVSYDSCLRVIHRACSSVNSQNDETWEYVDLAGDPPCRNIAAHGLRTHSAYDADSVSGDTLLVDDCGAFSWSSASEQRWEDLETFDSDDPSHEWQVVSRVAYEKTTNLYLPAVLYGPSLDVGGKAKRKPCFFWYVSEKYRSYWYLDPRVSGRTETVSYLSSINPANNAGEVLSLFTPAGSYNTLATSDPAKAGLYKNFSVVLEQPIVAESQNFSNHWGFSKLYIGRNGVLSEPENPDSDYVYSWSDILPVDMGTIFGLFSKTLDADISARGASAGLVVSIYGRV
jgi:hypothetical protein